MASISRATLPQEFMDIASAILLNQPEPQYLYAMMWKAATGAALTVPGVLGLDLAGRATGADGAAYVSVERDRLMFEDKMVSGLWTVIPELGKGLGEMVRISRPAYTNSTYTQASRDVTNATISTTGINVSSDQTSITLRRFAGPYDSNNSRVAPYTVEQFDAAHSMHRIASITGLHMQRDYDRFLEKVTVDLLDAAATVVRPNGFTADTDFVNTASGPLDYRTIAAVERSMDDANIPVFPDGKRHMVLAPAQIEDLLNDAQFARYAKDHKEINPVLNPSYFKTVGNFHIFKSTMLTRDTTTVSGVTINRGHAYGPGVLGSGVGMLPGIRQATDDNYGNQAKLIWQVDAGFTNLDNRFVRSVRSSST